jgi:hypothetical protein
MSAGAAAASSAAAKKMHGSNNDFNPCDLLVFIVIVCLIGFTIIFLIDYINKWLQ